MGDQTWLTQLVTDQVTSRWILDQEKKADAALAKPAIKSKNKSSPARAKSSGRGKSQSAMVYAEGHRDCGAMKNPPVRGRTYFALKRAKHG